MKKIKITAELIPAEEGGYVVYCPELDITALVQFNWGTFQDCYGLPSSPIFDKNFGPDFMHCWR